MYYVLTTNGEPEDMYPLYDLAKLSRSFFEYESIYSNDFNKKISFFSYS